MSTAGVRRARDALADIELVAQLRSAFADAQAVMGQTLVGFGLTEQRYHLLLMVAAGGPVGTGQGALAKALHSPESRISLLVHELCEAGLVEAVRDDSDRRHVKVRLRGDGEEILSRAISVQREALHSLISTLEVTEVTRLAELVARTYLGLELSVSLKSPKHRARAPRSVPATEVRIHPEPPATSNVAQLPSNDAARRATATG
jgi:DNA-binding MarR family transcriptional regulator